MTNKKKKVKKWKKNTQPEYLPTFNRISNREHPWLTKKREREKRINKEEKKGSNKRKKERKKENGNKKAKETNPFKRRARDSPNPPPRSVVTHIKDGARGSLRHAQARDSRTNWLSRVSFLFRRLPPPLPHKQAATLVCIFTQCPHRVCAFPFYKGLRGDAGDSGDSGDPGDPGDPALKLLDDMTHLLAPLLSELLFLPGPAYISVISLFLHRLVISLTEAVLYIINITGGLFYMGCCRHLILNYFLFAPLLKFFTLSAFRLFYCSGILL
jgi:hypothetical protein